MRASSQSVMPPIQMLRPRLTIVRVVTLSMVNAAMWRAPFMMSSPRVVRMAVAMICLIVVFMLLWFGWFMSIDKEAICIVLKKLKLGFTDSPAGVTVDYLGQELLEEDIRAHYVNEALEESRWLFEAIAGKLETGRWLAGLTAARRFWLGARLRWVLDSSPEGEGLEWLHAQFVESWERVGYLSEIDELVSLELGSQ